jgi:type IV pilus assembly protein PilM
MAEAEATIALNIGSQRVSMAVFETAKNGELVLKKYASGSILADPAAEVTRLAQVRVVISDLAQQLKLTKASVRYAIPGQSVFTRFVKLPPLDADNLDQLVEYEAQQHVPFPIDEVVWDWELIDPDGIEKEVVIVAIKGDALDEINEAVLDCGLTTLGVDAAPMAVYNAFRYNYPQEKAPVLIVDVGAKATTLVYVEGKRFFTRSLNIGGAAISAGISKEYGISFAEAENQKVTNGVVSLGGNHTAEMDEATAGLATVIRNTATRLPSEISRTNNYYRSQHEGTAPTKIYLAGGGANLPGLKEFLEERVKLPIEIFNPLGRVSIGKGVDVEQLGHEAHLFGELVGLGLRGSGGAGIEIDLVPAVVQAQRDSTKRRPLLVTAACLFLVGLLAWAGFKAYSAGIAAEKADEREDDLAVLDPPAKQLTKLQGTIDKLDTVGTDYANAQLARVTWVETVNELKDYFARENVWVTDLQPLVNYQVGDPNSGSILVKDGFEATKYGGSSKAPSKGEEATHMNAIRIKGYWRKSTEMQNAVNKILDNIRKGAGQDGSAFNLISPARKATRATKGVKKQPATKEAPLKDGEIFAEFATTLTDETTLGAAFTMVLPLSQPISVN